MARPVPPVVIATAALVSFALVSTTHRQLWHLHARVAIQRATRLVYGCPALQCVDHPCRLLLLCSSRAARAHGVFKVRAPRCAHGRAAIRPQGDAPMGTCCLSCIHDSLFAPTRPWTGTFQRLKFRPPPSLYPCCDSQHCANMDAQRSIEKGGTAALCCFPWEQRRKVHCPLV